MNRYLFLVLFLTPSLAYADSPAATPPPTVTLTQAELQAVINASVANFVAKEAFDKVQKAFIPPKEAAPK